MIDDEFEKMFRQMIERFFGSSVGLGDGIFQIRVHASNEQYGEPNQVRPTVKKPVGRQEGKASVEKIDLGESMIVVVEGFAHNTAPSILVKGKKMRILSEEEDGKEMTVDLPFEVDLERSTASFRNGIVEVELVKAENPQDSNDYRNIKMV